MYTKIQVTFDAADPEKLAQFWELALGYVTEPPPEGFAGADVPRGAGTGGGGSGKNGEPVSGGTAGPAGDSSGWPGIPGWRGSVTLCRPLSGRCQYSGSSAG